MIGTVGGVLLSAPVFILFGDPLAEGGLALGLLVVAQPIAYLLTALGLVAAVHPRSLRLLRGVRSPRGRHALGGVGLGVGGFVLSNVVVASAAVWLLQQAGLDLPPVQETFEAAAADATALPYLVIGAVLLAPIAEELVFRGVLYPALARRVPRGAAMWLSAAVFAVVHGAGADALGNVLLMLIILPFGVLLAWGYERTGTLLVPVAAHVVFNAISVSQLALTAQA